MRKIRNLLFVVILLINLRKIVGVQCRSFVNGISEDGTRLVDWCALHGCCQGAYACNDWSTTATYEVCENACSSIRRACSNLGHETTEKATIKLGENACSSYFACHGLAEKSINLKTLIISKNACKTSYACYDLAARTAELKTALISEGACSQPSSTCYAAVRSAPNLNYLTIQDCTSRYRNCQNYESTAIILNLSDQCSSDENVALTIPTAECKQNFNLYAEGSCRGIDSLTVEEIEHGSSDNCGIASMSLVMEKVDFDANTENSVGLEVTNTSGNKATCSTSLQCNCPNGEVLQGSVGSYKCIVPPPPDPCQNNKCNRHGSCFVNSENKAECRCEDTFQQTPSKDGCECPPGLLLQQNINRCIDLCKGIDCNGHGDCDSATGECNCHESFIATSPTSCECAEGYKVNESNKCGIIPDDDPDVNEPTACEDNESFEFPSNNDPSVLHNCTWISQNSNRLHIRQHDYCFNDQTCESPSNIGLECQQSCGFCDGSHTNSCLHINGDPESRCMDVGSFMFPLKNSPDTFVNCAYITQHSNPDNVEFRRNLYCSQTHVGAACPHSCAKCDTPYQDDPNFSFHLMNIDDKAKNCDWLGENWKKKDIRIKNYCLSDDDCTQASEVGDNCPVSCGFTRGIHWNRTCDAGSSSSFSSSSERNSNEAYPNVPVSKSHLFELVFGTAFNSRGKFPQDKLSYISRIHTCSMFVSVFISFLGTWLISVSLFRH